MNYKNQKNVFDLRNNIIIQTPNYGEIKILFPKKERKTSLIRDTTIYYLEDSHNNTFINPLSIPVKDVKMGYSSVMKKLLKNNRKIAGTKDDYYKKTTYHERSIDNVLDQIDGMIISIRNRNTRRFYEIVRKEKKIIFKEVYSKGYIRVFTNFVKILYPDAEIAIPIANKGFPYILILRPNKEIRSKFIFIYPNPISREILKDYNKKLELFNGISNYFIFWDENKFSYVNSKEFFKNTNAYASLPNGHYKFNLDSLIELNITNFELIWVKNTGT